jgi:hypothetical protein
MRNNNKIVLKDQCDEDLITFDGSGEVFEVTWHSKFHNSVTISLENIKTVYDIIGKFLDKMKR